MSYKTSERIKFIAGIVAILAFIVAMLFSCKTTQPDNYDIKPYYKIGQKVYLKPDSFRVTIKKGWRTEAGPKYEGYYFIGNKVHKTRFFEFEVF